MATKERIKLEHLGELLRGLSRRVKTASYKSVADMIIPQLRKRQQKVFNSQTSPTGEAWAPLSEETLRKKRAKGGRMKILHDTNTLRRSLTTKNGPGQVSRIKTIKGVTRLFWGTEIPYSIFHTQGTANMPARPHVVGPDDRITRSIVRGCVAILVQAASRKGKD